MMSDKLSNPTTTDTDNKYFKLEKIGVGSHGVVIKAKDNRTGGLKYFVIY